MVQEAATYIDTTPNAAAKLEFIGTLRTITEGKIYVEVERARITRILAKIKEDDGKVEEAADVLQELQVETFGSMEKREKTDFILEQMRLNLARKDFVRAQIISKKINTKYFDNEDVQDLKLRYYELMIQNALHDAQYLNVCKYYREVYATKSVKEDEVKWSEILRFIVMFIALAPYDNEQSDLIHRISLDKNFEKLPLYKQLLKSFTTVELMRWPKIDQMYKAELQKSFVFSATAPGGSGRWKDLHDRVIEHNIRVISNYYERITIKRLTELLDLTANVYLF
jgi:26S proteasome regulatory subunit N5